MHHPTLLNKWKVAMSPNPLDAALTKGSTSKPAKKRSLVYLLLLSASGLGVVTSVFAASVSINNNSTISYTQGTQVIAACDSDGIEASLGAYYDSGQTAFVTDTITLTDVDSGCEGKTMTVELFDGTTKQLQIVGAIQTSISETVILGQADNTISNSNINHSLDLKTVSPSPLASFVSPATGASVAASSDRIVIEIN